MQSPYLLLLLVCLLAYFTQADNLRHRTRNDVYNFEEWWTQCIQQKGLLENQNIRYIMSWEDETTNGEHDIVCWYNNGKRNSRAEENMFGVVVASRLVWIARIPREMYDKLVTMKTGFTTNRHFLLNIVYKYFWRPKTASNHLSTKTLEDANIELQLAGGQFIRSALLSPTRDKRLRNRGLLKALDDEMNILTKGKIKGSTGEEVETGLRASWSAADNGGRFLVVRYHSWELKLVKGQGQVVQVLFKSFQGDITLVVHCEIGKDEFNCRKPPPDVLEPGTW